LSRALRRAHRDLGAPPASILSVYVHLLNNDLGGAARSAVSCASRGASGAARRVGVPTGYSRQMAEEYTPPDLVELVRRHPSRGAGVTELFVYWDRDRALADPGQKE
jgi:hypothetical protein